MPSKNRVMVSIPKDLKARLDRLSTELLDTYESGRGCQDIELAEQGSRGIWVPIHEVIRKALDELESHRERSRKPRGKQSQLSRTVV